MHGFAKKLIEAHTLGEPDSEDGFSKGCALIRANLGVDAEGIETEEEWARLYGEAVWLEGWRYRNLAKMIGGLLGGGKG